MISSGNRGAVGRCPMSEEELGRTIAELADQQRQLLAALEGRGGRPPKDTWDKLGSIAPIVSGFLIAGFGAYFTMQFNQQQIKLQELQTIERFIPHLAGNEKTKKAAILAMSTLGNTELASKMASLFASEGTVSALQSIAQNGSRKDRNVATQAMARAFENMASRSLDDNRLNDAEKFLSRALEIKEKIAGPNSPELCETLERLADLYTAQGRVALAEPLERRSLSIRQSTEGAGSEETISTMRRLAKIVGERGDRAEAESLENEARAATARTAARATSPARTPDKPASDLASEAQAAGESGLPDPRPVASPAHTDPGRATAARPDPEDQPLISK